MSVESIELTVQIYVELRIKWVLYTQENAQNNLVKQGGWIGRRLAETWSIDALKRRLFDSYIFKRIAQNSLLDKAQASRNLINGRPEA